MEYFRTIDNQIRAGFAFRIGKLASQYETLAKVLKLPEVNRFDATLTISLLHSLLTNTVKW